MPEACFPAGVHFPSLLFPGRSAASSERRKKSLSSESLQRPAHGPGHSASARRRINLPPLFSLPPPALPSSPFPFFPSCFRRIPECPAFFPGLSGARNPGLKREKKHGWKSGSNEEGILFQATPVIPGLPGQFGGGLHGPHRGIFPSPSGRHFHQVKQKILPQNTGGTAKHPSNKAKTVRHRHKPPALPAVFPPPARLP